MPFVIVDIDDGGATCTPHVSKAEVEAHLRKGGELWEAELMQFIVGIWLPGDWMPYPNGWIFCIRSVGT